MRSDRRASGWLAVAAAGLVGGLTALVLAGAAGDGLANARDDVPLYLFLVSAVAAGAAWWRTTVGVRSERRRAAAELAAAQARAAELTDRLEHERTRAHDLARRFETERDWRRHLRDELVRSQAERGLLGATDDVPSLILRTALLLVGAEKGLLLSRRDDDEDGDLDLLAAEGFSDDPAHSRLAQRFAREAIAKDATVREDDPTVPSTRDAADSEIRNLVAIPIYIRDRFSGVVVCANRRGGFEEHADEVLLALGDHAGAALHNSRLHGELRSAYFATVAMLAQAVEAKDPFLRIHSSDATRYVAGVARGLGLSPAEREELVFGSLLHDVGKIGISERILLKPGGLTPHERSLVELHPRIGCQIVSQVPALRGVAPAVLHHHERFDGGGYPARLTGEEIPLAARIVAIVDAFSAMTTDRPYRKGRPVEEAIAELERCAGTQFDPQIVELFVAEVRRGPRENDTAERLVAALSDPVIRERRRDDEPLLGFESYSLTDNLTLLYGHRRFHEVANAEARRAEIQREPFAVVLARLDSIGEINREHGYAAGDDAIRAAAHVVQRVALEFHATAAREGGAVLGIVIPRARDGEAGICAHALRTELAAEGRVSVAFVVWRAGESGDAVVERAKAVLRAEAVTRVA